MKSIPCSATALTLAVLPFFLIGSPHLVMGQDCNANGIPDDQDIANQGAGFDDPAAWSTFDAKGNNPPAAKGGYLGAVFDGQYIYFTPSDYNPVDNREILRFNTDGSFSDALSWETYDPGADGVGTNARGYHGGAFDGRYVYFSPRRDTDPHGEVLRFDTLDPAGFGDQASWAAYDPGAAGVGVDPDGFTGAVYDGSQYVYFVPYDNGTDFHGEVLRYDARDPDGFTDPGSWATYDPGANGVGTDPDGFMGGVFDGQYVYFVPQSAGSIQYTGEVMRFDTLDPDGFADPGSWAAFDASAAIGAKGGYFGGVFANGYVYFAPYYTRWHFHGEVLRYSTAGDFLDPSSWETFDAKVSIPPGAKGGYTGVVFDEDRYIYFVPFMSATSGQSEHGEVLRYDTLSDFATPDAWATFDAGDNGVGDDPDGFGGAVFASGSVYFVPLHNGTEYNGEVLRYDTTFGWSADCNGNGIPDECDIADGDSQDFDGSLVPDECEDHTPPSISCPGDAVVECDGTGNAEELAAWLDSATASDDYETVTLANDFAGLSDDCGETGSAVVTWTATDVGGNMASCAATFTVGDTTAPVITGPDDVTVECGQPTDPSTTGTATADDTCSSVSIAHSDSSVPGPGNTETITRTWTATDECGNVSACDQIIEVVDTTPPVITCPPDAVLECPADTSVEANGTATATDTCSSVEVTQSDDVMPGPGGTETITRIWTATDECGNVSACEQIIEVVDATPPSVSCSVATDVLWAPDHHLVNVGLTTAVSDECDPTAAAESLIVEVWSDETEIPDTGDGTGRHAPDAKDLDVGLRLRNERRGAEEGRVYLIVARAEDGSGNVGFALCTAVVPHDQSQPGLDLVAAEAEAALDIVEAEIGTVTSATTIADLVAPLGYYRHGVSAELGPHQ